MISRAIRWISLAGVFAVGGCFFGFVHDEVLDGPYRLVAVDVLEDMMLCRSIGSDGYCIGDRLPGPTVFQAGANPQYIVFARHPLQADGALDRSVTEFYYILRQEQDWDALKPMLLTGPLNEIEYQREKVRLQLPEFSRVFDNLK